jgi:diguanylate cyclase (GGDEF)-like protein
MGRSFPSILSMPAVAGRFPHRPLLILVLSAGLLSVLAAAALIVENRRHVIEAAERDNSNIAGLVGFHISHILESGDHVLSEIADVVRTRGLDGLRSAEGKQMLVDRTHSYPALQAVALIDGRGDMVAASSLPFPPPRINYADREYFGRHAGGEDLIVGEQLMSRSMARRGTTITRAIRGPDGKLVGVAIISIDAAHFNQMFQSIQRSPDQAVAVLRFDGAIFARLPEVEVGQRFPNAAVVELAKQADSGTFYTPVSALDGVPRLVSFERIKGFPLVVAASRSSVEVLTPWWNFSAAVVGSLVLVLGLLAAGGRYIFQAAKQMEALHVEYEFLARTDPLTRLANRRHFLEVAEKELSRAERYGEHLAVLMMDVDHFKRVNDTYGHRIGDQVLSQLADRCRQELRDVDTMARVGGEEFALLLPETDSAGALEVADRLCRIMADTGVPLEAGLPLHFTVSIGVSARPETCTNIDVLLSEADTALYRAKHSGRNRALAYARDWAAESANAPA